MEIVCLDMEGTLTEEIWEKVAHDTGIEDLGKTTRDIPSYESSGYANRNYVKGRHRLIRCSKSCILS